MKRRTSIHAVPATEVALKTGMWATRVAVNADRTVPYCLSRCEDTGRLRNFDAAAARDRSLFEGLHFNDSDVFKTLEGVATVLAQRRDLDLERQADELIARIAAAQEPDGYLYTIRTSGAHGESGSAGPERWSNLRQGHELYNVGHLYEAAVAYADATGKDNLLAVATKSADFVADTFGPDALVGVPGHEEIEIGLMRLARKTGRSRYAELARFFLDARGRAGSADAGGPDGSGPTDNAAYAQDHLPVLEQTEAVGHAVRAGYLYIAMTETALGANGGSDADSDAYAAAVLRLWHDIVGRKLYLTGGIGARPEIEGFGEPYELPNDSAYAETCASIALVLWARRLFLLTGSADHYDVLERTLYNGLLAGVALGGAEFFYANPLEADGVTGFNIGSAERQPWFECSCCPTNVARFTSTVGSYIFATSEDCVYVNLYIPSEATVAVAGAELQLNLATEYPWNGSISLTVQAEVPVRATVRLRLPGWARGRPVPSGLYRYRDANADRLEVAVNRDAVTPPVTDAGYLEIAREWRSGDVVTLDLPMPVRFVEADDRVQADRGKVAIERGPLVYCLEQADNGGDVRQRTLTAPAKWQPEPRPGLLGGVTVLTNGDRSALLRLGASRRREHGRVAAGGGESMTIARFDPTRASGDELRRSYVESGYVLVRDLVDEVDRAEITRELRRINRGDYSHSPIEGVIWRDPIEPVDWPEDDERLMGRHMYLGQPHVYSAVVRDAMTHAGICRVLDHVVGACVPFWDGAYKCMQSMFVVKPPGGAGSPWHQDEHPIPTRDRSLTGVWIALADATVADGCLWIVPDSHKSGVIYERYAHDLPDVDSNPVARGFDETGAIPIEMAAGSVLFFSGYLLHSSRKNRSDRYRPALTFHYCSASTWLTWGGERNFRGVVQVRGEDPYADLGYTTPQPWVKER